MIEVTNNPTSWNIEQGETVGGLWLTECRSSSFTILDETVMIKMILDLNLHVLSIKFSVSVGLTGGYKTTVISLWWRRAAVAVHSYVSFHSAKEKQKTHKIYNAYINYII